MHGVPQSYVDIDDATHLRFSYVRRLATVVSLAAPPRVPLRVLHLGAGAMTLARYIARTRPGSPQVVVDLAGEMVAHIQRHLPLPAGAQVEVVSSDARAAVQRLASESFDLIITDVYVGARMPRSVATVEFATEAARLLGPGGVLATNLADLPPLAFTRVQVATLRSVFPEVCAIGEPGLLRGRRYGNVVLVAGRGPQPLPAARLARLARADPKPARLLRGTDLDAFVAGAVPLTDATSSELGDPLAQGLGGAD